MTTRTWKRFLMGATTAAALTVPGIALADPTCVYVMGQVDSVSVATPAVIVAVPDSAATVQPVRVHLDEEEHSIIGYSLRTPGVDEGTHPTHVFVPGTELTINPIVATTPELPIAVGRCVNQTVSTPAIPVYVPESVINTPGAAVEVPAIELNILGNPVTTAGKVLELPGKTIIIPAFETAVPGVSVSTPDKTIVIEFSTGGYVHSARHLAPTSP
jgi:hypothetical protein